MSNSEDRAAGAIVGALIGDALGVGNHWYYDLDELRRDYGWVSDYVAPKPGRYHAGLLPGQGSQTGQVLVALLESLVERGAHDPRDFGRRLDELLATLDGTPQGGRYTNQCNRDLWHARRAGKAWDDPATASWADSSEAAQRMPLIVARYFREPRLCGAHLWNNARFTHADPLVVAQSVAFGCVLREIVAGGSLSPGMMRGLRAQGTPTTPADLPALLGAPRPTHDLPLTDALLMAPFVARAAQSEAIKIDPPRHVAQLFGLACAIPSLVPAAYYLAARLPDDFEAAVLEAVNSGGNNMARAALTGALVGARVGLSGIPQRFVDGLEDGARLAALAQKVAVGS